MSNDDLPDNVTTNRAKGTTYYQYRFPDGTRKSLGSDRADACRIALALNTRLAPIKDQLAIDKFLAPSNRVQDALFPRFVALFQQQWIAKQNYKPRTLKERQYQLNRITKQWQHRAPYSITTYDVAQFLNTLTPEAARQHRNTLKQLFTFGMEEGILNSNPVKDTAPRRQPKRVRHRHTWQGFNAILAVAEPWLQRTMKLALYSVQRRGDLVMMHRDQINLQQRTLKIKQEKTGVYLEIGMGEELYQVVKSCVASGIVCPFLVHTKPKRMTKTIRDAKPHHFAVTANTLSHEFQKARDLSGAYDHLPRDQRPSFHDIRALGIFALHKAGFPVEYIQALAGHAGEAMTLHYIDGHEQRKPLRVEAGLSINNINWSAIDWEK